MSITKVKTANHEEWKDLRSRYIGGSDAAAVVGLNSYSSPYSLWAEKTGRLSGFDGNLATEVGTFLEEFVAQKFAEVTGKKVRRANHSFFNSDYPWAIANIDREIVGEDAGLEIKTTDSLNLKKFKNGEYPEHYYVQCVHYLAVTGCKKWYLAVLVLGEGFYYFEIERDEGEINALMESEEAFWKYVESKTPPATDGMTSTTDTITILYPESNGETVNLLAYEADLKSYMTFSSLIKDIERQRDEVANRIKAFLGEAGRGESDNYKVSWSTTSRSTFDSKRFASDNPDIDLSEYYKKSTYRTFKVTKNK